MAKVIEEQLDWVELTEWVTQITTHYITRLLHHTEHATRQP